MRIANTYMYVVLLSTSLVLYVRTQYLYSAPAILRPPMGPWQYGLYIAGGLKI